MASAVTVRELTTGAELQAIAAIWDAVLGRSVSNVFFLTHAFQSCWWEALGEGRLRLLVGTDGGAAPRFIAPLYATHLPGLGRTLRLLGGTEVADYLDILAAPAELAAAWETVFEHLRATPDWETLDLRALPDWSASRQIVAELAAASGWQVTAATDAICPIVRLPADWPAYLASLRQKDRHELRRKIGRLARLAAGERFTMLGADDDLAAAVADFTRLHRASGHAKNGFWDERTGRFFERLIRSAHMRGWLRLAFQEIDGARAAALLAFRYGDRYYVYNSGYDPAYRALAAGVVCMGRAIAAAIAEGAAIFDLLQGDEPYKYDFGAAATPVYRVTVRRTASV